MTGHIFGHARHSNVWSDSEFVHSLDESLLERRNILIDGVSNLEQFKFVLLWLELGEGFEKVREALPFDETSDSNESEDTCWQP